MEEKSKTPMLTETEILEQLFENNCVTVSVAVTPKHVFKFKTLKAEDQLHLDKLLGELKGTQSYILHKYAMTLLSYTIISLNTKEFKNPEEVLEYLQKIPTVLLDKILKDYQKFDNLVKQAINPESIKKTFTTEADQMRGLELPQED